MESSRRDLPNDMAEHRSILKNNQNTFLTRFGFTTKPCIELPETRVLFMEVSIGPTSPYKMY